jgi:hypothetical protein
MIQEELPHVPGDGEGIFGFVVGLKQGLLFFVCVVAGDLKEHVMASMADIVLGYSDRYSPRQHSTI